MFYFFVLSNNRKSNQSNLWEYFTVPPRKITAIGDL